MKKRSIEFQDSFKKYTTDQDKAITPEETLNYFYDKVEGLDLKILNEVKRIDNGRLDIPVFFSVCGEDALSMTGTKKQMGKGASPIQAEASACMELAERFSFFSFKNNPENFLTGDYKTMAKAGYPVLGMEYLLRSVHSPTYYCALVLTIRLGNFETAPGHNKLEKQAPSITKGSTYSSGLTAYQIS